MRFVQDQAKEAVAVDVYDGAAYLGPAPGNEVDVPYVLDSQPHAFIVQLGAQMDPIRTHYHRVDQFQYIRSGSGRISPHKLGAGSVHYTDANTPYGPVAPGPDGLSYLTLRGRLDNGAFYMPDSRSHLKDSLETSLRPPRSRRNVSVAMAEAPAASSWTDLMRDDDELRIAIRDLPAATGCATPAAGGGGAYIVVVSGSVELDGADLPTGSIVWLDVGESAELRSLVATRLGLLQFPVPVG